MFKESCPSVQDKDGEKREMEKEKKTDIKKLFLQMAGKTRSILGAISTLRAWTEVTEYTDQT